MSTLSEELVAARKAKQMTQEQLAAAMNASRSAVSHWESGRNEPDLDTLRRLSEVLECSFSVMQPAKAIESASSKKSGFFSSRRVQLCSATLACAVIVFALFMVKLYNKPVAAESSSATPSSINAVTPPEPGTIEWYASAVEPQEGMPYVSIHFNDNPLPVIHDEELFGDRPGWFYTTYLTETGGQPFTITHLRIVYFTTIKEDIFDYDGETVASWFDSSIIPARGEYSFNGGSPMDPNVKGLGFLLNGLSADDTELEFHTLLNLLYETEE